MSEAVVRPGRESDLPELVAIYNHFVENTHVTFDLEPFAPEARREWFREFTERGPYRLLVAELGDEVGGYACSHEFRHKRAYRTSVETSVYVRPAAFGRGLGRALYRSLFAALDGDPELHRAYAGVALPNPPSLALHRDFGFREVGTFREVGFKLDRYWDVCWLERPLG
ncbi:MAG TPA: GNAT family N-acetyltransferase [bacterium]|nr:GNAT family N-acetyltransferase [bacterium]